MRVNFETEATANASPVSSMASTPDPLRFDCKANAETSIAAIWQVEGDRLLKQAYRLIRKVDGADPEAIVSDALVIALERWESIIDATHCRKMLSTTVRLLCMNVLTGPKRWFKSLDERMTDPRSYKRSPLEDSSLAWIMDHCNETEQRVLTIYLLPDSGNQSAEAIAQATQHWQEPWSVADVWNLFRKLRKAVGIAASQWRTMGSTTIGTLPGWHTERHTTLGCLTLLQLGPRPLGRHVAQHTVWTPTGWMTGGEETTF